MTVIDSLEFARTAQTLSGNLPVPELARLRDSLFDDSGEVRFEVRGARDARRRPVLALDISGVLHLRCQRCLGMMDYPLRISNTLLLVSAGEAAAGSLDDEESEWIEASAALDVASLVEDEIILGLPYAPRHGEGQCGHGGTSAKADNAGNAAFTRLAALKRNSN